MIWDCGLDSTGFGQKPLVSCYEFDAEHVINKNGSSTVLKIHAGLLVTPCGWVGM
jgi:hypothetical protein